MTHIAGYGLLAAILVIYHRTGSALWTDPKVAQRLHQRRIRADARRAGRQVRPGSAAHLDSRSHGGADTGKRAAARGLLRQGRRLPRRPHAQLWRMAGGMGRNPHLDRHRHHGRRRDVRHGADRT